MRKTTYFDDHIVFDGETLSEVTAVTVPQGSDAAAVGADLPAGNGTGGDLGSGSGEPTTIDAEALLYILPFDADVDAALSADDLVFGGQRATDYDIELAAEVGIEVAPLDPQPGADVAPEALPFTSWMLDFPSDPSVPTSAETAVPTTLTYDVDFTLYSSANDSGGDDVHLPAFDPRVVSLFQVAFGTMIDDEGRDFWSSALFRGLKIDDVADAFVDSVAFEQAWGEDLNTGQFLDVLYDNTFDGPADADGKAFWTEQLDSGALDRGDVALAFSTMIGDSISVHEARAVAYLYEAALDRDGAFDFEGLNFWIDERERGLSQTDLSQRFLDSEEFASKFGDPDQMSDRALVEQLYENVLDRAGEEDGIDFWVARLEDEGFSRADVLLSFADSAENRLGSTIVEMLFEVSPGVWDFLFG